MKCCWKSNYFIYFLPKTGASLRTPLNRKMGFFTSQSTEMLQKTEFVSYLSTTFYKPCDPRMKSRSIFLPKNLSFGKSPPRKVWQTTTVEIWLATSLWFMIRHVFSQLWLFVRGLSEREGHQRVWARGGESLTLRIPPHSVCLCSTDTVYSGLCRQCCSCQFQ